MFIKCEMFRISHAESLKFSDKMSKDMLMHSKLTTELIWVTFHQISKPYLTAVLSQLAMGCVACHTCHGCVTDFRPILGNPVEVTHVTSPGHVYIFPC